MLVDAHCHVDLYDDPQAILSGIASSRTLTVSVSNLPSHFDQGWDHQRGEPLVRPSLGLHPGEITALTASALAREMSLFKHALSRTTWVGEIGLDGRREHRASLPMQQRVFREVLDMIGSSGSTKIASIHSSGAVDEVLAALAQAEGVTPVLHWFSGNEQQARVAALAGCWFSVNPSMLRSAVGRARVLALPPDRVITESDGPFVNIGKRHAAPWDVELVVEQLARLWGTDAGSARDRVWGSFSRLASTRTG